MVSVKYSEEETTPKTNHNYKTDNWAVVLKAEESKKLKVKIEKAVDKRKEWVGDLTDFFINKMEYIGKKTSTKDLNYEESLTAIIEFWKEKVKLNEIAKQQVLK